MGLPPFFFCVAGFLSGPVTGLLVGLMIFVKLVFLCKDSILFAVYFAQLDFFTAWHWPTGLADDSREVGFFN